MATNQGRYNNDQYQRVNITTSSLTYFDENGIMFKTGFLNENISIAFGEPSETPGGKRKYPIELRDNLLLTNERVGALYDIINTKVMPAIENKQNYNGGVFTSMKKDNVFEIRVEFDESGNHDIYASFHKNIDANRIPQKTVLFKFAKVPIIEKYDTNNGSFVLEEIDAQFFMFVKLLEGFMLCGANNTVSHSHRNANRYTTDKIFKYLSEIATKLGVSVENNSYNNTNYTSGFDNFNNQNNSNSNGGEMPPMREVDSIDDIM